MPRDHTETTAVAASNADPASGACSGEESALVRRLFTVHNMMMRVGDRLAGPIGLTSSRWLLLCALGRREQPPTVSELSDDAMLSAQNVSRMLASMESEGLVERLPALGRGRAVLVRLTEQGAATLERTRELAERFEESFLRDVSGEEVSRLEKDLQKLIENLERFEKELSPSAPAPASAEEAQVGT